MKKMKLTLEHGEGIPYYVLREILLMKKFDHKNIVEINDVIIAANRIWLIFDYIDGDLCRFLQGKEKAGEFLEKEEIKRILKCILEAIERLHSE